MENPPRAYTDTPLPSDKTVFSTPWFEIFERQSAIDTKPFYGFRTLDFAVVVGLNARQELLMVRQFRPVIGQYSIELPAGQIEAGETPEEAARKELCEETGHEAGALELLAKLCPATSRFTNRMWVFFAPEVRVAARPTHPRETAVECFYHAGGLAKLLENPEFLSTSACGALFAAAARGKIRL